MNFEQLRQMHKSNIDLLFERADLIEEGANVESTITGFQVQNDEVFSIPIGAPDVSIPNFGLF